MDAGFTQRYAKVRPSLAKKNACRAPSDACLKQVLGGDQDLVFTLSNPGLKSALLGIQLKISQDDSNTVVDVDQQMALVMLLRSETVWNSLLIFYREICQRFEMTQGHRNEVEDRVSIAPITEKEKKITQGSLFDNEILLECIIAKRLR